MIRCVLCLKLRGGLCNFENVHARVKKVEHLMLKYSAFMNGISQISGYRQCGLLLEFYFKMLPLR